MAETNRPLRVFLSHASVDKPAVRQLYRRLKEAGIDAWLDEEDILPGQDWEYEISKAVRQSDATVFCLSSKSVQSERFVQRELRYALDAASERPEGTIFLIPARLDDCPIPLRLSNYTYVDLFEPSGYRKLIRALQAGSESSAKDKKSEFEKRLATKDDYRREKAGKTTATVSNKATIIVALIGAITTIIAALISSPLIEKFLAPSSLTPSIIISPSPIALPTDTPEPTYTFTPGAPTDTPEQTFTPTYTVTPTQTLVLSQTETPTPLPPSPFQENIVIILILALVPLGYVVILFSLRYGKKVFSNVFHKEPFVPFSNPYIAGLPIDPVSNPQMFFGRSDIVDMVSREIKEPKQKPPLLLYGRRRMGKTSALLNLGRLVRGYFIVDIFIDSQDIKYRTDMDLTFNLIQQILTKLKGELPPKKLIIKEEKYQDKLDYQNNPIGMLSDFFSDCSKLLEKNNLYCLLMFDEYELLGDTISKDFFHQIRSTMQHNRRFVFLFTGTHLPNELPTSNWKEVFMNVKTLPISFLDRQDGYDLLTKPVQDLKFSSKRIINDILDVTGCQPLMLQAMGAEIVNLLNAEEKRRVNKTIYKLAVKKVLDSWSSNFFDHIWNSECDSKNDKELLSKVARANGKLKAIYIKEYDMSLQKLKRRDLLKIERGYVKLTIPLIKIWLEGENHL